MQGSPTTAPRDGETAIDALAPPRQSTNGTVRSKRHARLHRMPESNGPFEISIGSTPTFWQFSASPAAIRDRSQADHRATAGQLRLPRPDPGGARSLSARRLCHVGARHQSSANGSSVPVEQWRVSRKQFLIDAGKKTFTSDRRFGQEGYGLLRSENSRGQFRPPIPRCWSRASPRSTAGSTPLRPRALRDRRPTCESWSTTPASSPAPRTACSRSTRTQSWLKSRWMPGALRPDSPTGGPAQGSLTAPTNPKGDRNARRAIR